MAHKAASIASIEREYSALPLLTSPLIPGGVRGTRSLGPTPASTLPRQLSAPDLEEFGYRDDDGAPPKDVPEFQKHADATAIEVFYDLFFAANLTVFSDVTDITNTEKLATFVVYFSLIWFNWALLGLYDVRFITDSIFERAARAIHFGVMVGFAVICPNFSLSAQQSGTFQTMSVILMTSRLTMATQYGTILWYCRGYRHAKVPLAIMIGLNFVAGMIYLGLGFSFGGGQTALYSIWFIITAIEVLVSLGLSLKWDVLSFQGTHLASRVSLLTFILMGEGLGLVCLGVVRIVQNANSWTPATIGNVVAGVASIYIVFMIYFDWRRSIRLGRYKQLIWSFVHYPFHLAMRIFIEGSSQFVVWWKVIETITSVLDQMLAAVERFSSDENATTTESFVSIIDQTVVDVFNTYVPKYATTMEDYEKCMTDLRTIPDEFWTTQPVNQTTLEFIEKQIDRLVLVIENSLLAGFKIDGFSGFLNTTLNAQEEEEFQATVSAINEGKFNLVFKYSFIAAGITLILMNVLFIITSSRRWTVFNYIHKTLNFLFGIGLCLVTLVTLDPSRYQSFSFAPWPLPTLVLVYFAVLVIHHLPHPPPIFFGKRGKTQSKPKTEGWEAARAVAYRDKTSEEASDGHSSQPKVVTPGYREFAPAEETDTLYRGAGAQS